jgi:hypothetical protein
MRPSRADGGAHGEPSVPQLHGKQALSDFDIEC